MHQLDQQLLKPKNGNLFTLQQFNDQKYPFQIR